MSSIPAFLPKHFAMMIDSTTLLFTQNALPNTNESGYTDEEWIWKMKPLIVFNIVMLFLP